MKKLLLMWFLLLWSITLIGCNKTIEEQPEQPVIINSVYDYNDAMVWYIDECINVQDNIRSLYEDENVPSEDIIKSVEEGIKICNKVQDKINKLWDWQWDSSLKDASLEYMKKYIEYFILFKERIPNTEILHVYFDESTELGKQYKHLIEFNEELSDLWDNIWKIQNDFAKKYWYQLEWDPIDKTTVLWYNDLMVSYIENCNNSRDEIFNTYNNSSESGEVIQAINDSLLICEEQKKSAESLWDWEWDSSLKDSVIKFLELNIEYINKFSSVLKLKYLLAEIIITDEEVEKYNEEYDSLNILEKKVNLESENLWKVQDSFAKKFNLPLE